LTHYFIIGFVTGVHTQYSL